MSDSNRGDIVMVAREDTDCDLAALATSAAESVHYELSRRFQHLGIASINVKRVPGPRRSIEIVVRVEQISKTEEDYLMGYWQPINEAIDQLEENLIGDG
jgi:hypothetical protein